MCRAHGVERGAYPPPPPLGAAYSHCKARAREAVGLMRMVAADVRALHQPRRAASIAAMSIFVIPIIASNARLAAAGSGSLIAFVSASGVICQDRPHLSLHQPHALASPPL